MSQEIGRINPTRGGRQTVINHIGLYSIQGINPTRGGRQTRHIKHGTGLHEKPIKQNVYIQPWFRILSFWLLSGGQIKFVFSGVLSPIHISCRNFLSSTFHIRTFSPSVIISSRVSLSIVNCVGLSSPSKTLF